MPQTDETLEKLPGAHLQNHHHHIGVKKNMVEDMEELLTVREVARRLRVDDTTVRRWIKNGSLDAITLPHRGRRQAYRVKKSTMDRLLQSPRLPE
jgi:excisionase family DNA binding protein